MDKLSLNSINQMVYVIIISLIFVFYYFFQTIESYVFSSIMLFATLYYYKGFQDLKTPISLFNYFYFFFVVFGFFAEATLRGFDYHIGLMVLVSAVSYNFFLPFRSYQKKYIDRSEIGNKMLVSQLSFAFCCLSVLASIIYFKKVGSIPLFSASSPEDRINAMTGYGYLLQPMRFGPVSAIILYFSLPERSKKIGLILFLLTNLLLLGTGFRGTFFQNFILFLASVSVSRNINIGFYKSVKLGLVLILSVVMIGIFRGDGSIISSLTVKILHSVSVSIYILNTVIEHFEGIKYGATFFYKFSSILPMENIEFTQWLTTQLPINFSGGVTPTIVGDMYINFGGFYWAGMLLIGMISLYFEKLILQSNYNYLTIFLVLTISLGLARTATGGLSNTLFQTCLSCMFVLAFIMVSKLNLGNKIK